MTRQVTDNLYIELDYFTPEEYYTYEAVAESALSNEATLTVTAGVIKNADSTVNSEFTQTAQAVKLVDANVNLNCEFTQTATISHIEGSDMFAFTEAQIAVQVDRIRDTNIEVSDVFSIATDVVRYRDIASDSVSESTITIGNQRILNFQSAVQGAFSISANGIRIRRSPVALASTVSLQSSLTGTVNARVGFVRSPKTITLNGTVTRNTTIKRFGDSSAQFAATGVNYLAITPFSDLNRGTTGDFTIEGWFYHTTRGSFFEFRNSQSDDGFYIYTSGTALILFHRGTSLLVVSNVVPQNQWNHIALSRQGSNLRLFANGTQAGSTYTTVINFNPARFEVGRRNDSVDPLRGYADEIRISNIARYTANFTPSTSAFTNDANTLFLSHFDDTPFSDDVGTTTTLSQFTLSIVSGDVESGSADLESAFTIDISAGVITLAQSTQTVQTQLTIEAVKSVEASVSLNSEFQQTQSASVSKDIAAALTANSSLGIDFTRLRNADSTVESNINLNSSVEKLIQLSSDAGSLFDVGISAVATINSFAILYSSTELDASVQANRDAGSNISAASNLQTVIEKNITAESSVNSEFTQTVTATKLKNVVVSMVANTAISTAVTVPTQRPRPVFLNNISSQSRTGIETSIKKFGSASGFVIGSGYAEYTATNGDLSLGTGDFAIEIWTYPVVSRAADFAILSNPYALTVNALVPRILLGTLTLTSSTAFTLDSWNHLVISKTGSRSSMFLNGVRVATSTTSFTASTSSTLRIRGYSKTAPLDDDPGIYYDDFSFHKGSDIGFNAANTTITVPTEARINLPAGTDPNQTFTQLLVHFDGNFEDDIKILQQAQAVINSNFNLISSGSINGSATVSINFSSSVIVAGNILSNNAAALTSQGFVLTAGEKFLDAQAEITAVSDIQITGNVGKTADLNAVIESELDIDSSRIRTIDSPLVSEFQQTIDIDKLIDSVIDSAVSTDLVSSAVKTVSAAANVDSSTNIAVTATQFSGADSNLVSEFSTAITAGFSIDSDCDVSAEFEQQCQAVKTTDCESDVITVSEIQTQAQRIRFGVSVLESEFQQSVIISRTRDVPSEQQIVFALDSEATRIQQGQSDLNSETSVIADINVITGNIVDISSESSLTALIGSIRPAAVATESIATQLTAAFKNATGTILLESQSTVTAITGFLVDLDLRNAIDGIDFKGTGSQPGDHFFKLGSRLSIDYTDEDTFLIAFWAYEPQGTVLSTFNIDAEDTSDGNLTFVGNNLVFKGLQIQNFTTGADEGRISTWTNVRKSGWAHYMLYQETSVIGNTTSSNLKLYVDGQLQSSPTVTFTGISPGSTVDNIKLWHQFGIDVGVLSWSVAADVFKWDPFDTFNQSPSINTMSGALSQFVTWWGDIPDITDSLIRQRIYDSGYVELGNTGVESGLLRPNIYLRFQDYTDVSQRGKSPILVTWRQATNRGVSLYEGSESDNFGSGIGAKTSLEATLVGVTEFKININTVCGLSAVSGYVLDNNVVAEVDTDLDVTATITYGFVIDTASDSDLTAVISATFDQESSLDSEFALAADASFLVNFDAEITARTELYLDFDLIPPVRFNADLIAETTVFVQPGSIEQFTADIQSGFTVETQAFIKEPVRADIDLVSISSLTAVTGFIRQVDAGLSVETETSTVAQVIADIESQLLSDSDLDINVSRTVGIDADLPVIASQLSVGDIIHIDPFYQIKVEQETRQATVLPENRLILVEQETRLNIIL
jgi:hypothetical protein